LGGKCAQFGEENFPAESTFRLENKERLTFDWVGRFSLLKAGDRLGLRAVI
jgi:hypothetical protein